MAVRDHPGSVAAAFGYSGFSSTRNNFWEVLCAGTEPDSLYFPDKKSDSELHHF